MPQHASSPTREGASISPPSCSSYIVFQSANVFNSRSPCWCTRHYTTSCLRTWRKTANLCRSLDTDECVRRTRHMPSAANQHTFCRSLIRCCWTSSMEQSANPAARIRHYTRTILTSTQNASIWSLIAAGPSDSVFLCAVYKFAYLLNINVPLCASIITCSPVDNFSAHARHKISQKQPKTRPVCQNFTSYMYTKPATNNFTCKEMFLSATKNGRISANRP